LGNCYIFNPANGLARVTVNGIYLDTVYPASAGSGYQPQFIATPLARHDDGQGCIAVADPNTLSVFYQDDPNQQFGPYAATLCLSGRGVSVDNDLIIYVGRAAQGNQANVVTMTTRGFVLDTRCTSAALVARQGKAADEA